MYTRLSWTRYLLLLVIVQGWVGTGCGDSTSSAGDHPIHLHVVCLASADGQSLACDSAERLGLFTAWVKDALSRPQSTFSIWAVGPARQHYQLFFSACVPEKWGSSVFNKKTSFMAKARQAVSGSQTGLTEPDCRPPEPRAPGIHHLTVSPQAVPIDRDVWQKVASGSASPPLHLSIVCDRSESTLGVACTTAALLRAFDLWVAGGLASAGSSLSVDVVGPSRDTTRSVFDLSVPEASVGERVAFILGVRAELTQLLTEPLAKNASAIVEAINAAVRKLRERDGRYRLYVLSALRQLTPEWNFEHNVPQAPTFITWLKKTSLFTDLRDIPVLVCGLHTRRSPTAKGSFTATRAARLQELWQRTFQDMGAADVRMFTSCDTGLTI